MVFIFKTKARAEKRTIICSAVKAKRVIEFYYHGGDRAVEPFCLGMVMSGDVDNESLLCYQVGGYCEYGESVGWKLYRASEIEDLRITDNVFSSDRPGYNPANLEMKTVYCCVSLDRRNGIEPNTLVEPSTPITQSEPRAIKRVTITFRDAHATKRDIIANVDVKPEKASRLFTPSYIRMIKLSRKLNHNRYISGDIYFHPTERKILVKSIDLSLPNTFYEVNRRPRAAKLDEKSKQLCEKRWIEAYLINQAKHNNWNLTLHNNEYSYLLSQFIFRRDIDKGERQGKILDLLLYNNKKQHLVLIQLMSQADISVLDKLKIELADLVNKLKVAIETGEIAQAFGFEEIKGILAYLMWPKSDIKYDLGKCGLIEFEKNENPWELYKENGKDLEIMFNSKKGAFNLL